MADVAAAEVAAEKAQGKEKEDHVYVEMPPELWLVVASFLVRPDWKVNNA
jgi:hypothetical protein